MTKIIPKQYQSQIIIGLTVKVGPNDDAWMVQQQVGEFLARVLQIENPHLEITSVSSSFIPRAPNPMDFMMGPGTVEEIPDDQKPHPSIAGTIPPSGGQQG